MLVHRRHHFACKQLGRAQRLLEAQVTEGKTAQQIVEPRLLFHLTHLSQHGVGCAGKNQSGLVGGLEILGVHRETRLGIVLLEQMQIAGGPAQIAALGDLHRLGIGRRQHHMAGRAHAGQILLGMACGSPAGAIAIGDLAHHLGRAVGHQIDLVRHTPGNALRVADAIPDRRMRLLLGLQLQRHLLELIEPPLVIERVVGEGLHQHLEGLDIHRLAKLGVSAEVTQLERRDTAPHAHFEAAIAHLVELADFLIQAQRMVEVERVHQRTKAQTLGALGHRRMEHRCRRTHAQRRGVMLGGVQGAIAEAVIGLGQTQPVFIELRQRRTALVDVIVDAKFHARPSKNYRKLLIILNFLANR